MRRASLVALLGTATAVAAVDLAHKGSEMAGAGPVALHERSAAYGFVLVVAVLWAAALLAAGSPALAAAGGLVAGGALGNVASLALWSGVPNPLVVEVGAIAIAFNLADVAAFAGGLVLVPAAVAVLVVRRRRELRRPVGAR